MNACEQLVDLVARLATETDDPRELLLRLGTEGAGIRRGLFGVADLARGGTNVIPGGGVKRRFDDETDGQIRHFAGIATAAARIGPRAARTLSVTVLRDPPSTADGRLTDAAIEFASELQGGDLPLDRASTWVAKRLCG